MKSLRFASLLALLLMAASVRARATAQSVLGRLESDIRQANGQPAAAATIPQKVYSWRSCA